MKDVLRCAEKQKYYDETDINSIYQYALGIEGKTLLQILYEANLSDEDIAWVHSKETDKGLPGKIIEASYFGYELNSRQEADFEKVGVELKTTPADIDKKTQRFKSGETISVTQIDFNHPVEFDFYKSHVYQKLRMLLVIFYYRDRLLRSKLQYNVFYATLFQPSEEDIAIIESDFNDINRKIASGCAHMLSRTDGTYLGTAPKSTKTAFIQPYYGGTPVVKRSFTLKKEYVNVILSSYYTRSYAAQEEKLLSAAELIDLKRITFAEKIQERFRPYLYRRIEDIAASLNLHMIMNKATLPVLTARMLGLSQLRCEEYEVIKTGWTDSELYKQLDELKYLFVVFQNVPDGSIIFKGSKLWSMSEEDIALAFKDWMDIRNVLRHGVQLVRRAWGDGERTYNNFPGVADARRIHLRPHGEKAFYVNVDGTSWGNGRISDTEPLPDGRRMTRQSYWLSNIFVRQLVSDLVDKYL